MAVCERCDHAVSRQERRALEAVKPPHDGVARLGEVALGEQTDGAAQKCARRVARTRLVGVGRAKAAARRDVGAAERKLLYAPPARLAATLRAAFVSTKGVVELHSAPEVARVRGAAVAAAVSEAAAAAQDARELGRLVDRVVPVSART